MKRYSTLAVAVTLTLCLTAVQAFAQNTKAQVRPDKAAGGLNVGALDEKTMGGTVRASQLIGMNLQNDQGKSVGEISDFVLDANDGRMRYVAVTYGGLMGVGNKLFAVPFEAFKVRQNPDDPADAGDFVLVLNVTQAQLKGAVGFDKDHWPNMADQNFTQELYKRYGVERSLRNDNRTRGGVDVNINRNGVDVDVDRN